MLPYHPRHGYPNISILVSSLCHMTLPVGSKSEDKGSYPKAVTDEPLISCNETKSLILSTTMLQSLSRGIQMS